jgi:hypothetical protein
MRPRFHHLVLIAALSVLASACSPRKFAVNRFGNAISGDSSVYNSDNDPDLVREAMPFGLKTYENLLEVSPDHRGLLLSAAAGFASYAYLLKNEADRIDNEDYREAGRLRERATNLYLRGRDYASRGLSLRSPDFKDRLVVDLSATLAGTTKKDVAFLYWVGASWGGALSAAKGNAELIAALPFTGAMMERVIELDAGFNDGAAYEYMITYEAARPGGDPEKARGNYEKALEFSGGKRASVYLALAEGLSVQNQDLNEFRSLLEAALLVDPDGVPHQRLLNTIAHRRALRLGANISDLFLEAE